MPTQSPDKPCHAGEITGSELNLLWPGGCSGPAKMPLTYLRAWEAWQVIMKGDEGGIEKEFQDENSRKKLLETLLLCPFARQCIVKMLKKYI